MYKHIIVAYKPPYFLGESDPRSTKLNGLFEKQVKENSTFKQLYYKGSSHSLTYYYKNITDGTTSSNLVEQLIIEDILGKISSRDATSQQFLILLHTGNESLSFDITKLNIVKEEGVVIRPFSGGTDAIYELVDRSANLFHRIISEEELNSEHLEFQLQQVWSIDFLDINKFQEEFEKLL